MKSKKSSIRFNGSSSDLLHNKYILYISFFFAILTAARYLFSNNLEAIVIFVVIGFLTTYFSKNMIIVLLTTTIGTNFIMMFKNKSTPAYYNIMEGMESGSGATAPPGAPPAAAAGAPAPKDVANKLAAMMNSQSGGGASNAGVGAASNAGAASTNPPALTAGSTAVAPGSLQNANESVKTTTETMTQLTPASYGGSASSGDAALSDMFKGMASGISNQKNQAYNTLSSLGSGAGANGGDLLSQQNEMINNLKTIQPILQTAEKFLDKFENSSISKMMGSIPGMSLLTGGGGGGGGNSLNPAPAGS